MGNIDQEEDEANKKEKWGELYGVGILQNYHLFLKDRVETARTTSWQ